MKIVNISLKTEFNFKKNYGKISDIKNHNNGHPYIGVADLNNTFSHSLLEKELKGTGIKPIFGVRLEVICDSLIRSRGCYGSEYLFIAKNNLGLQEINNLVRIAYENFYYKPMVPISEIDKTTENIFVITSNPQTLDHRIDFIGLSVKTPYQISKLDLKKVLIQENYYFKAEDKKVYEVICGAMKRGDEYFYQFESQTYPQHILSTEELKRYWDNKEALENTKIIAEQCDVVLPRAKMVSYSGARTIESICEEGARKKKIDIKNDGEYKARYDRELKLITEKKYVDYFMIVAEMIIKAKKTMLVGPSRGSSAGSLVCFLMGITEIDPIKYGLIFERFIDINREDLPDIDVDFPDHLRGKVVKDLFKNHGKENVCHISNINKLKPKSAINDFGTALRIPKWEIEQIKNIIAVRSFGDARAALSIMDTLETTELGKSFINKYPNMKLCYEVENHASHAGKHAGGIIVCNDDLTKYGGINARENTIMLDKRGASYLNLLKIDVLGLRTLSILQDCAKLIGMDYMDYYKMPLDDEKSYEIINSMRLSGIFQFEGDAMNMLCRQMGVKDFDDIISLTALARPGPLQSGSADKFVKKRTGEKKIEYLSINEKYINITKSTYGEFIYQEQIMFICREIGMMSWAEVSVIRDAISKSKGKEFFDRSKEVFKKGAKENGISEEISSKIWDNMTNFGSYAMNKSHVVAYGHISYWCAYMKANHPLEFFVATLNHAKDDDQVLKILRDAIENEGIENIPVDPDISELKWIIHNGKLLGGLTNIVGVGDKKAKEILSKRKSGENLTSKMILKMLNPETPYDIIYPAKHYWGQLYEDPKKYGLNGKISFIKDIGEEVLIIIGKVIKKDLKDLNGHSEAAKRGGKLYDKDFIYLKLTLEDDTAKIFCVIDRFDYAKIEGPKIYSESIEDETWLLVKGKMKKGWNTLYLSNVYNLSIDENELFKG